jgi:trk system potassium uptake protein TrkH
VLGLVLLALAAAELAPLAVTIPEGQHGATLGFLFAAGSTCGLAVSFRWLGRRNVELFRREGVLIVVGSWILASASGALPYLVSGAIPAPVDALFESASGFTTTGASILRDVEAVPSGILFWRSLTQWLGGIGIIVLFVALLSELGPGARFLFKLEVPGPKAEILHPKVRETALVLFRVYLVLTVAMTLALLACGLSPYDALTHTFSTVSTGGFSPHNDSVGHFGTGVRIVVILFMLASGVNFSLYYLSLRSRSLRPLWDAELRTYLAVVLAATAVVAIDLSPHEPGLGAAILDAIFQVVSIVTTTGYATADFSSWPGLAEACLVALMVGGGCAGSTAGGAKVIRLMVGLKATLRDVRLVFSPNTVIAIVIGRDPVPNESVSAVLSFLVLFGLSWGVGALLLSVGDTAPVTAATASIAMLSNVGPGLGEVGPSGNYAFFAPWQKLVMVGLMWLGRLELFAVAALLQPRFWNR